MLTAIEKLARTPDLRHRVEKAVFLLIHSGDDDEAVAIARSDREKVIVAISSKDLLAPDRGDLFVRSKLSAVLGSIDLFGMSSPVPDRYFFGRSQLVQQLSRRLHVQRQNAGLFGLPKTGKTSVLFAIRRTLEPEAALVDYFDCQSPGIHGARWWQVLGNLATRVAETARSRGRQLSIAGRYTPETAGTQFGTEPATRPPLRLPPGPPHGDPHRDAQ